MHFSGFVEVLRPQTKGNTKVDCQHDENEKIAPSYVESELMALFLFNVLVQFPNQEYVSVQLGSALRLDAGSDFGNIMRFQGF